MTEFSASEFRDMIPKLKKPKRKNKMNARRQECGRGHKHDSIDESRCCPIVYAMFPNAKIEPQKTIRLYCEGKHIVNHRVDWFITEPDGTEKIVEYKGFPTEVWRIKRKLTEACYPHIEYTVMQKRDLK